VLHTRIRLTVAGQVSEAGNKYTSGSTRVGCGLNPSPADRTFLPKPRCKPDRFTDHR